MAATELLDWTGETVPDMRERAAVALSGNAAFVLERVRAGVPLNALHVAINELLGRFQLIAGGRPWGSGVDLAAGSGYASAALSRRPDVNRVYVLEQARDYVETVMPEMFDATNADHAKLVRVLGSFNDLRLPDASLDFVLAIGALHHSEQLPATLAEIRRVLRVGGHAFVVDRYQPDSASARDLERLLDVPIGDDLARRYGYEPEQRLTRRDLGEHELRLSEWKARFFESGFTVRAFAGVDFETRRSLRIAAAPWRALLELAGDRVFFASGRSTLLGAQVPFDNRWLMRVPSPSPVNLLMVCTRER